MKVGHRGTRSRDEQTPPNEEHAMHPAGLPPLSLTHTRTTTDRTCPWCADTIPAHHAIGLEDRLNRPYCKSCAAQTDRGMAHLAQLVEDFRHRLLGLDEDEPHIYTAPGPIHAIADEIQQLADGHLRLNTEITETGEVIHTLHPTTRE